MKKHSDIFRAKIADGHLCLGMVLTLTDPVTAELAGELGFDFVWIDAEHGTLNPETISNHIMALQAFDCAPFVRVPWNEWGIIKPILDMAPAGIIIPMVNSPEEAEKAVSNCRYPPRGIRGCGAKRGRRYGLMPLHDYFSQAETDPLVIIQIEHIDALPQLDKILAVPGIDSVCIGPADLSCSMDKCCCFDDPEVIQVLDEISGKVKKKNLPLGTADCLTPAWQRRKLDWIACAGDLGFIASGGKQLLAKYSKRQA